MDKVLHQLEDNIIDTYDYLSEYANEYLEPDQIERITDNAIEALEDNRQWLGKTIYDMILDDDNSAEYEAWYIAWLKEAIDLFNKYNKKCKHYHK